MIASVVLALAVAGCRFGRGSALMGAWHISYSKSVPGVTGIQTDTNTIDLAFSADGSGGLPPPSSPLITRELLPMVTQRIAAGGRA